MKIAGKTLKKPKDEVVVIPRDGEDFIFKAQAVLDYDEFDMYCPEPKPPTQINAKTGETKPLTDNKKYKESLKEHNSTKIDYLIITSLSATPDLEWEDVQIENPSTYNLYEKELRSFGLTESELGMLIQAVMKVNGLSNEIYEEAKKRFLAGQLQQVQ